jgi:hypothetical protein
MTAGALRMIIRVLITIVLASSFLEESAWCVEPVDFAHEVLPSPSSTAQSAIPMGAILSNPSNERHLSRWHARTYGLLAANRLGESEFPASVNGMKQGSISIPHGQSLSLRYRVLLHTGDPNSARIQNAYESTLRNDFWV